MEPRIHMIALGVRDMVRSITFYRHGLGFKRSDKNYGSAVFFETKGVILELFHRPKKEKRLGEINIDGILISHNAKSIDEIENILNNAEKFGGFVLKKITATSWGGYHAYFADPDGYCWVINYWSKWIYDKDGSIKI